MALEVHEGITHIRHGALVQGAVEEVKGPGKAQVLQLRDELPLGVAIRDVTDPGHVERVERVERMERMERVE